MRYVSRKELIDYKITFYDAIQYLRKTNIEFSYYYRLIGSGKRNLVLEHHNKGFDLDYQILFYQSIKGEDYQKIKSDFLKAFDLFFVPRGYQYAEDSTSAITIKYIKDAKIHHSYDITLISPETDGLYIIRYEDSEKTILTLKRMKNSKTFQTKYKEIKGAKMWRDLRSIYKEKKETFGDDKKSFSLLIETVKEVIDIES